MTLQLGLKLKNLPPTRNPSQTKEVLLQELQEDGCALRYASFELQADREVVLAAVKQEAHALSYASMELRADKDVVLEAIRQNRIGWEYACKELRLDKSFLLEALKLDGLILGFASYECRGDREAVLAAVESKASALRHAREDLLKSDEFMHEAIERNGLVLEYAGPKLRSDKDFVLKAVKQSGAALAFASDQLRDDRDTVLQAIKQYGPALGRASLRLRTDQDLLLLAARCPRNPDESFGRELQAALWEQRVLKARDTAIAVRGEEAPIVSVAMSHSSSDEGGRTGDRLGTSTFHFDVSLLSGANFTCCLPEGGADERPLTTLDELAKKIVDELRKQTEMPGVERVFMNFVASDDGDFLPVSPWEWAMPLGDLLRELRQRCPL